MMCRHASLATEHRLVRGLSELRSVIALGLASLCFVSTESFATPTICRGPEWIPRAYVDTLSIVRPPRRSRARWLEPRQSGGPGPPHAAPAGSVAMGRRPPEAESAVVGPRGDEVAVRMGDHADHVLFVRLEQVAELALSEVEGVEEAVLSHGMHPPALRCHHRSNEVAALPLARREARGDVSRERRHKRLGRAVADEQRVGRVWQERGAVDGELGAGGCGRAERVEAVAALSVPHAHRAIGRGRGEAAAVGGPVDAVDVRGMPAHLL
mmetsp:Transcript_25131/g.82859  ORF Transcript_25131/g.82859 Transcript_25131/m.82859 type:complete len:268 (+) Transcript_25131:95-898(+)